MSLFTIMCLTINFYTNSFLTIKSNMIAIGKKRTDFKYTIQSSMIGHDKIMSSA